MALTMYWPGFLRQSAKRIDTRRINNHIKLQRRDQVSHLLTPPSIVKHSDGERITPAIKRKNRKVA